MAVLDAEKGTMYSNIEETTGSLIKHELLVHDISNRGSLYTSINTSGKGLLTNSHEKKQVDGICRVADGVAKGASTDLYV